ncbi:MAG: hypothetical protein KME29_13125 [Calothrix sp. FI2-JRJ7]|jgi:hypothetical protein|nr:hypothetical protein [Calothrix sp. FI2-JRJ7]
MNFEFKKILPIPVRTELTPKPEGEEIFKMPTWKCFCCHDTGWVRPHIAKLVIAEYDSNRDRTPVCQGCEQGRQWFHLKGNIDTRLHQITCKELDKWERDNWEETVRTQFEKLLKNKDFVDESVSHIATAKSLRQRARISSEQSYAQYKHDLASRDRYELKVGVCNEEA